MPRIERIRCKSCREPIDLKLQVNGRLKCPACGTVHKLQPAHIRPRWKAFRPQFLLAAGGAALLLITLIIVIVCAVSCSGSPEATVPETAETTEPIVTELVLTPDQQDAMALAEQLLADAPFSYAGLISQLEYEGYDYQTADFAVARCSADWFQQAEISAREYLELGEFDRQQMLDALLFEGFTTQEAEFAADQVGLVEAVEGV